MTQADFGFKTNTPNTVSGTIWNDTNADGILSGETGAYGGVTVALKDSNGDVVATAITDANEQNGIRIMRRKRAAM